MTDAVDALTEVAEAVRAEEQPQAKPEPIWNLSQILRAMRETKNGDDAHDQALVSLMCILLDIPRFEVASRVAVEAQVLG